MEYAQTYIPHEYIELKMPPGVDADGNPRFRMDPNHLHIWPRHSFMLIALPNKVREQRAATGVTADVCCQDKSFTCTLFAPTETFDELAGASRDRRHEWFKAQFSDALDLIGADLLLGDLERNPRASLISIKVDPPRFCIHDGLTPACRRARIIIAMLPFSWVTPRTPWCPSTGKD
jgi:kynurenine 3-monooxygenase